MSQVSQSPQAKKIKNTPADARTEARLPVASEATFGTYESLQAIGRTNQRVAEAREMLRDASSETLIEQAVALTRHHFASDTANESMWRVLLYAPLYVWNQCVNHCKYCGFQLDARYRSRIA